jgi:hypothetical protein
MEHAKAALNIAFFIALNPPVELYASGPPQPDCCVTRRKPSARGAWRASPRRRFTGDLDPTFA